MKAFASQSPAESAPARKQQKAAAHPAPVSSLFPQTEAIDGGLIQRQANCPCGGGCPRCRDDSHLPNIQTKLAISTPGDRYEQEADHVAEQVMRMEHPGAGEMGVSAVTTAPPLQRKCAECEEEEEEGEEETIQMKEAGADAPRLSPIHDGVESVRGDGEPLSPSLREFFEPRFGYNFENVRMHTGVRAAESARALKALAYTRGHDVVFASGQYSPQTASGIRLLAHELAHVVQQGGAGAPVRGAGAVTGLTGRHMIQRQADVRQLPPALPCVTVSDPGPPPAGTTITFSTGTTVTPAGVAGIAAFHSSWAAAGGTDEVSVDGFASVLGAQRANWRASCDRAQDVKSRLVVLGIPATKITTFAHGESTASSTTSTAANTVAIIHSGQRLAASDLTLDQPTATGPADSIFFDRGSSRIPPGAQTAKIAALAVPADRALTLFGYTSEDETGGVALADARIAAVDQALRGPDPLHPIHTGTQTPDNAAAVSAGQGQIDYRGMRRVVVRPTGAPSGVSNCGAGPRGGIIPCSPATVFTDAQTRADALLAPAISALTPLTAANQPLFDSHFHTTAANRAGTVASVRRNLNNLQSHIATQMTPVSSFGPGPTFEPGPGHRCANDCDSSCGPESSAYNIDVDASALMTLCDTPRGFVREPDVDERAAALIHEGLHGITLQIGPVGIAGSKVPGADDLAYTDQRFIRFLDPATALRNSDSYVNFIRELAGHLVVTGRSRIDPITHTRVPDPDPATGVAMSAAERLDVDRALAWLERWILSAAGETGALYGTINESIAARSWTNSYYEDTMRFLAPRFGLTTSPTGANKTAVSAIAERYERMLAVLYSDPSINIHRVAAGTTSWSAGPRFDVTIGPDFFAIPAGTGHDRAQLDLLLRAIITATRGVSADAVTRYMDLVDQIRMHQSGGTP